LYRTLWLHHWLWTCRIFSNDNPHPRSIQIGFLRHFHSVTMHFNGDGRVQRKRWGLTYTNSWQIKLMIIHGWLMPYFHYTCWRAESRCRATGDKCGCIAAFLMSIMVSSSPPIWQPTVKGERVCNDLFPHHSRHVLIIDAIIAASGRFDDTRFAASKLLSATYHLTASEDYSHHTWYTNSWSCATPRLWTLR
jgi:hypothetical protein